MQNSLRDIKPYIPWVISLGALAASVVMWAAPMEWRLDDVSLYRLFPLLGLIAFSLMWSHYASGFIKQAWGVKPVGPHHQVTSYIVLLALVLHPGILAYLLWQDGLGLPFKSTFLYVGESLRGAIFIGIMAWTAFLFFELHRWFRKRSWWKYVGYANELAMFLIIIHGLRLGSDLQSGWARGVWWFYAASLVVFMVYKHLIFGAKRQA